MGGNPDAAVEAARAVGIARIVQVGVDVESSRWGVELAGRRDDVWAAVAVHPNEAPSAGEAEWEAIDDLAAADRVVAIGETGLDHFRTDAEGWAAQETSFRRHIDIAKRHDRALMIHDREAHEDVLRVLEAEGPPARVIFHCFSGDADFARRCVERGYVLSYAGNVTFTNAQNLRDAAAVTPLDQMLVETDAPFLTPTPYRGRPNSPSLVPLTVRALAEATGATADEVAAGVTGTAARTFGW
jgi:TatD DNase family protein